MRGGGSIWNIRGKIWKLSLEKEEWNIEKLKNSKILPGLIGSMTGMLWHNHGERASDRMFSSSDGKSLSTSGKKSRGTFESNGLKWLENNSTIWRAVYTKSFYTICLFILDLIDKQAILGYRQFSTQFWTGLFKWRKQKLREKLEKFRDVKLKHFDLFSPFNDWLIDMTWYISVDQNNIFVLEHFVRIFHCLFNLI